MNLSKKSKASARREGEFTKQEGERNFWAKELIRFIDWYDGNLIELYGTKSPTASQRIKAPTKKDSAVLTWLELHQKEKYLVDLKLDTNAFKGAGLGIFKRKRLLDVGAGPYPSGLVFKGIELYCLDPLYAEYLADGYPIHYYENTRFVNSTAEQMPIEDNFFDAIISINAIDHVDDFHKTAKEIKRVLKPDGKLAMHVHYHKKTITEPLELNDRVMKREYGWCKGFRKISSSHEKMGYELTGDELYAVWRNF
jgi:SAM-dependent methyltransferase